jgi:hypothetical protein
MDKSMDYLDPKKKREHKIRLLVGYSLFAVAIGFATLLLVYMANGYDVDRTTGQVIQNGLIYVNTRPGGADVYLNDQKQRGTTDARLVVPAGSYKIDMKRAGYRDWSRSILLEGGSLRRLTYPRLIPEVLTTDAVTDLRSTPISSSQSIDKRWVVMTYADKPLAIDVFDTTLGTTTLKAVQIPEKLVANPTNGQIKVLEWADDNKSFIATYTVGASVQYLLVNHDNPAESRNLSTLFIDPEFQIQFQDRKQDKFFVYKPSTQSLFTASLTGGVAVSPYVTNVLAYKTFGNDWVLYITSSGKEGLVDARFKRGDKDIILKQIKTSDRYLLQLAKLGTAPIMAVSSTIENKAIVFNDPEKYLNDNPNISTPIATTVLRVENPIDLRISADSSVILAYGAGGFASHEFDDDRSYNFKSSVEIDPGQELRWLDGQHFMFSSDGMQTMMDFDGSNMNALVSSVQALGSLYSEDLNSMYTFSASVAATDSVAATPARLSVTSLLIEADR